MIFRTTKLVYRVLLFSQPIFITTQKIFQLIQAKKCCNNSYNNCYNPTMKTCKKCGSQFDTPLAAKKHLKHFGIPEPTICHLCSWRNKMAWQNEYKVYQRKCDATGKEIISAYKPSAPFPVYERSYWFSDKWDLPKSSYDKNKPFFEQYWELFKQVPRPHINQVNTVNSAYANFIFDSSDCYLSFQAFECEKLLYCYRSIKLRDSVNCFFCSNSELLFECSNCHKSYNLKFSQNCESCVDSGFLFDCKGCNDCFLSWNLRNKRYYFLNQKLTKEEYSKKIKEFANPDPAASTAQAQARATFEAQANNFLIRSSHLINTENCEGDYLINDKNCQECYFTDESEDNVFVMRGTLVKDTCDSVVGGIIELCYNVLQPGWLYNSAFTSFCYHSNDVYLSEYVDGCHDCVGCIGLKHGKYSILNKEYPKEEYLTLKNHIFDELSAQNAFENFFDSAKSPFAYDETIADLYFSKAKPAKTQGRESKLAGENIYSCETCGKEFKAIEEELTFYKKMGVALPSDCFYCRILRLAKPYSIVKLVDKICANCGKKIRISPSETHGKILCEDCYIHEVV